MGFRAWLGLLLLGWYRKLTWSVVRSECRAAGHDRGNREMCADCVQRAMRESWELPS